MKGKNVKISLCSVWSRCSERVKSALWRLMLGISHCIMLYVWVDHWKLMSDQIETSTEKNQCSTTLEIANALKISKLMELLVKMKISFILWKKTKQNKLKGLLGQPDTLAPCLILK